MRRAIDDTACMPDPREPPRLRFVPTIPAALTFFAALVAAFVLFLGRKPGRFRFDAITDVLPGFYSHVSNFTISYVLVAGIGYAGLMAGARMRQVSWLALVVVLANLVYEAFIPLLNTTDMVDAVYGVVGATSAWLLAWIIRRHGLRAFDATPRETDRAEKDA